MLNRLVFLLLITFQFKICYKSVFLSSPQILGLGVFVTIIFLIFFNHVLRVYAFDVFFVNKFHATLITCSIGNRT